MLYKQFEHFSCFKLNINILVNVGFIGSGAYIGYANKYFMFSKLTHYEYEAFEKNLILYVVLRV